MSDILSRKELEKAKRYLHNPARLVGGFSDEYNEQILDTALWLAEILDNVTTLCGGCPDTCNTPGCRGRVFRHWWRGDE